MPLQLTDTGLTIQTQEEIIGELVDGHLAIDPDWAIDPDNLPDTLEGRLIAVFSDRERKLQELLNAVFRSRDPSQSTGVALEGVCEITGTLRKQATKSRTTLRVSLVAGATVPIGFIASVASQPTNRWITTESKQNVSGSAGTVDVLASAEFAGPVSAASGTITTIVTPVSGVTAVTNPDAAEVGTAIETYTELRARRESELAASGFSPVDAIRRRVSEAKTANNSVTDVRVYVNSADYTDSDGLPPHSVHAVVLATDQDSVELAMDDAIAASVFASVAAGIETYGTTSVAVVDSQGDTHTIRFSRPSEVRIYVAISVDVDARKYVGDAALKDALVAYVTGLGMGASVIRSKLSAAADDTAGVLDVTALTLGTAPSPTGTVNLPILKAQIASLSASDITVTS